MKRIIYIFYLNDNNCVVPLKKTDDIFVIYQDIIKFWLSMFDEGKGIFRDPMDENKIELFENELLRTNVPTFISYRLKGNIYYLH
jgi:hypothetical protein